MLILTRKISETIVMTLPDGTEIRATILGVSGNQVKIGVSAPKDIPVNREEIHNRIHEDD